MRSRSRSLARMCPTCVRTADEKLLGNLRVRESAGDGAVLARDGDQVAGKGDDRVLRQFGQGSGQAPNVTRCDRGACSVCSNAPGPDFGSSGGCRRLTPPTPSARLPQREHRPTCMPRTLSSTSCVGDSQPEGRKRRWDAATVTVAGRERCLIRRRPARTQNGHIRVSGSSPEEGFALETRLPPPRGMATAPGLGRSQHRRQSEGRGSFAM
jgi:hypothetical protein